MRILGGTVGGDLTPSQKEEETWAGEGGGWLEEVIVRHSQRYI